MFFSRPQIAPLGWDLVGLPTPDGSKNFAGLTSDRRPVDFRFSGGWLTVERGPVNAPPDCDEMEEVLSLSISPFGTMDILPEQICDILGLTVNGQRIDSAGMRVSVRGYDWSGRTTYWESTHMMQARDDAADFIRKLAEALPGSILVQPAWRSHGRVRCRRIKFLMDSDEVAILGVRFDPARVQAMLDAEEVSWDELDEVFHYAIQLSSRDHLSDDVTGARYIRSRGADALSLAYDVAHHRRYRLHIEFPTADADAQAITRTFLSVLDDHFCRGLRIVNLETGEVLDEQLPDEEDDKSYSRTLRDVCLEKPQRYLFVGVRDAEGRPPIFYGARPATG